MRRTTKSIWKKRSLVNARQSAAGIVLPLVAARSLALERLFIVELVGNRRVAPGSALHRFLEERRIGLASGGILCCDDAGRVDAIGAGLGIWHGKAPSAS